MTDIEEAAHSAVDALYRAPVLTAAACEALRQIKEMAAPSCEALRCIEAVANSPQIDRGNEWP